ncbi:2,5-diamino-6-(ribosylamino)-4(3H)-pyrimidinone 5'-phosphate reductase [Methanosarcina mazei]|jgi:2,5-diamino-6-(ribosylamino)-4(3H)-pyrimidinone 5'-phosphate reductase|uniref:2,5-diamino-6-(ribosylamino)-4(3H)-pyrimidinone 5'-phosphate reductase n=5 Tax=Methanosarcina mazei TaxID=2209 RepID=A0A0F8L719_METMZ|nr:2,5-diamino-6-(ribosylamino)-4(3H)-pyrimidinone 5'-phosphate reductase [Methanosarcina mazei]AKB39491.1 5-amino-6-(5-phosphoribosylamino)uracil reductase [Methanosarcina mazei WWM610]AKB60462.1 5-amino-6-(5-phosphoribosylamino)uracil reductase [Methanosarcina mazei SarPi]AKB63676.1 5-amino-6-(5-phosphoribosylamino)uracil reductase [Methanosarcina mazei S-6]AKB70388.1 5-amino-6-(5-phosphoribosylamino)uracil reductase [Methanosarcina mazei C16]KKG01465.1 5-amino-6-(5-phosphoribosylamino)uraci
MDRPFIFINSAMSADGKLSTKERKQVKISGKLDFERMDELRAHADAIMVGIGTVLADDPSLTVKSPERKAARKAAGKSENPVRVVVDSSARTPLNADIFKKGEGLRIIAVSNSAPEEKIRMLEKKALVIKTGAFRVDLTELAAKLKEMGINSLMVEGGATLNWGMLSAGLVDEVYTFVGNLIIGGKTAPTFTDGEGFTENELLGLELFSAEKIEDGILLKWKVKGKKN